MAVAVTVSRDGGGTAVREVTTGPLSSAEPPDGVGLYDQALSINAADDATADGVAGLLATLGTWDEPRWAGLEVEFAKRALTAAWLDFAQIREGDRLKVTGLPAWLPPDQLDLMVRGFRERISNSKSSRGLRFSVNCGPYGPYEQALAASEGNLTDDFRVDVNERYVSGNRSQVIPGINSTTTSYRHRRHCGQQR